MSSLLVPIHLDALVIGANADADFFRWTPPDYSLLDQFESPWDLASVVAQVPGRDGQPSEALRVALHWALPDALTHAEPVQGEDLSFPPAPNRWLIARMGPDGTQIRIIESDYLDPDKGTTPYLDPNKPALPGSAAQAMTRIGRAWTLDEWRARPPSTPTSTFLRAIGPAGNLAFAAFAPHCQNVFAYVDDEVAPNTLYTYVVVGWHDFAGDDPLQRPRTRRDGTREDFAAILARLRWTLPAGTADRTLYSALLTRVNTGDPTDLSKVADPQTVPTVVVGNTAIEALAHMIELEAQSHAELDPAAAQAWTARGTQLASVMQALGYGRIDTLNQPDAGERLAMEVRDHWYEAQTAGQRWEVFPLSASAPTPSPADEAAIDAWLAGLNTAQARRDADQQELEAEQGELYRLWWSLQADTLAPIQSNGGGTFQGNGGQFDGNGDGGQFDGNGDGGQFEGNGDGSTQTPDLSSQQAQLDTLTKTVWAQLWRLRRPDPALPPAEAQRAAWADAQCKLPSGSTLSGLGRGLRAKHQPRFYQPTDPVVLIRGLGRSRRHGEDGRLSTDNTVACRLSSDLPTPAKGPLTNPPLAPEGCQRLLDEAASIHGGATPPAEVPGFSMATWSQPSTPLFLQWSLSYHAVPASDWTPAGQDLAWTGTTQSGDLVSWVAQGQNILTPHATATLASQLDRFVKSCPDDTGGLETLRDEVMAWDVLSQSLEGATDLLLGRTPALSFPPPGLGVALTQGPDAGGAPPPVGALVGDQWRTRPVRTQQNPAALLRAGLAQLASLAVVDAFGQRRPLTGRLDTSGALAPSDVNAAGALLPANPDMPQPFQLPPRLLEPTRLELVLLSAQGQDAPASTTSDPDPICGWLLPNHLDRGLALYDREGTWCREIEGVDAAPGTNPAGMNPTLAKVADALQRNNASLDDVLASIDTSAWLFDPLGNRQHTMMAVLVGRPLVVVRAQLALRSRGVSRADSGLQFRVRVGDAALRDEGLLGYFVGEDFDHLCVLHPPPAGGFLGTNEAGVTLTLDGPAVELTLILDPRGAIHLISGVLPVLRATLPAHSAAARGESLGLRFRVGPLLGAPGAPALPPPAPLGRVWTFSADGSTPGSPIADANQTPRFPHGPRQLIDGWLDLQS